MAKFDWRREDSAYAAATLFAAALVGFLVAGTFGLVASPFGSAEIEQVPQVRQALAVRTQPSETTPLPTGASATPSPTAAAPPSDSEAPSTTFTSAGGTSFSVAEPSMVHGTAADSGSGVHEVLVSFDPQEGETTTGPAKLTCEDAGRTKCTWTADVPPAVGDYTVTAHAIDRTGNVGEGASQEISVVNVGGTLRDLLGGVLTGLLG